MGGRRAECKRRMILDSEKQRNLLLGLLSEHLYQAPGSKALRAMAMEVDALERIITQAPLLETEEESSS